MEGSILPFAISLLSLMPNLSMVTEAEAAFAKAKELGYEC